jgi:5-methylcytosine-specific restriction enzyme subunit McrC
MLAYAFQELKQNNYEDIAGEDFDNIHDLFAEILAKGISYQLKQGLHKEYITHHESLTTLKGKLDINGTIGNRLKRNQQLYCNHDELSENCVFNRILKTTVDVLIHHPNVKRERRSALKKIMPFFCRVDNVDIRAIKWTTFRFDRNTRTYQMLLYICYFVLQSILLTTDAGKVKMKGFTDDQMSRLYEKFILEYYRKHHPELNASAKQIDWDIDKEESTNEILPIMKTDVFLTLKERVLIIDAKYYGSSWQVKYDKLTVHSNNLYQIHTYVVNYDVEHKGNVDGMLLYAKTQEEMHPDGQMKFRDGNVIYFRNLDLNQKFDKIKEQLEKIIQ